ncbi:MAG: hypothetical protein WC966_05495 [Bradymonadales bacterium]|jgi:hypothetical protein
MKCIKVFYTIFILFFVYTGCNLEGAITLEEHGPKCLAENANRFGRCKRNQFCDLNGPGGKEHCVTLANACDCGTSGGDCTGIENSNGYGYCLEGYVCKAENCVAVTACPDNQVSCMTTEGSKCMSNIEDDCRTCHAGYCFYQDACIPNNSVEACGANCDNCVGLYGAMGICYAGACKQNPCEKGQCPLGEDCVENANNSLACGESCEDCSKIENVANATCENANCVIDTCKDGYCKVNEQCLSNQRVETCGTDCLDCKSSSANITEAACVEGACVVLSCEGNLCNTGEACVNTNTHCGSNCDNCTVSTQGEERRCVEGECQITSCPAGMCQTQSGCENSTNQCGEDCNDCTKIANAATTECQSGSCKVITCNAGYCNTGNTCVNTNTQCGESCTNCTNLPNVGLTECQSDGTCKVHSCSPGFCKFGNTCVNTNTQCGDLCKTCVAPAVCINGHCENKLSKECNKTSCPVGELCCREDGHAFLKCYAKLPPSAICL